MIAFVLILLILGLLAFVILRSMMRERIPEEPEEPLPVDELLQSTPEPMEDIEVEPKSEERLILEKFVMENPEAAANLLRNWLNDEDWG